MAKTCTEDRAHGIPTSFEKSLFYFIAEQIYNFLPIPVYEKIQLDYMRTTFL